MIETKTKVNIKNIKIAIDYASKVELKAIERAKKEFLKGECISLEDFKLKHKR